RIEIAVLQLVGAQLVDQTDSPSLLSQIKNDPASRPGDFGHRSAELWSAIASQAPENVAGKASGMQAHQRSLHAGIADDDREMFLTAIGRPKGDHFRFLGALQRHARARNLRKTLGGEGFVMVD